ncbi:hypothetical protein CORC01_08692 [Colletotrichum orchidophilum]|uniref:C2H2-type domain-containing protein n=1 Tax=Colletotrichum orchidophilum TaxID=1209926 RepID=A0A1G4B3J9_9PEZI|nr:uncharacterized protein CORC01_08692 [Colletotrichum orchidophilum]OHE95999.1 hypothetical protein CORC01_08692 [Colletotrichum orchidophilum]
MASFKDPLVQDRWNSHDFDGGPHCCRWICSDALATPDPRVTASADMGDASASETHFTPVRSDEMLYSLEGGSSDDGGHSPTPLSTLGRRQPMSVLSLLRKSRLASISCGDCQNQRTASFRLPIPSEAMARVRFSDLANMDQRGLPDFLALVPESLDEATIAVLDTTETCQQVSIREPDGMTQSSSVGQGPEYVVKLLDRPSELDSACPQEFKQLQPFVNQLAQQIAESTTLYQNDTFYQQLSTSETELYDLSAATITVGRYPSEKMTHHPEFTRSVANMAVTTTGWPSGAQPVCAAPDTMNDTMYQMSPLSDLCEMPDESDDWAMLIQQDMLATGDFDMDAFDLSATEATYQTTNSPQDIFNDPTVLYDVAQSLGPDAFDFNGPLPDLSASGYLSGDQVSSYFGSTNTSPFEPALDFFPEADPYSMFPASADGSPLGTTTSSPGSDNTNPPSSSSASPYPYSCSTDGCTKSFRKEAQLKQHQRVHRKALVCTICRAEHRAEHKFAQVRDLERHLQARHKDVAEKTNVRSEIRSCPHAGCDHEGRRDNVSRHHKSKHGKELKWKRGVPHVVD